MFKNINKVIRILMVSDFFLNAGWGFLSPIFAIFIVQRITAGDTIQAAKVAGFAALFYWITKSSLQIPIGRYLDKNRGEKDDFIFMFLGTLIVSLAPLGFMISSSPWHIYLFNTIHALGMAMMIPSWYAIFGRHIDKGREAFEWGLDSTSLGIGVGITGACGGIISALFGFNAIFIAAWLLNLISAFVILSIRKEISPDNKTTLHFPPYVAM
ncbi:MAG: hypothetical protein A3F95_01140 [Candidatus Nealsonbacteria bacterium RIFCSPLOWO2_12_FULL_39_31]|uniref:Major facilitator superfamily (MFS) profile domain-containing protein n=3 Tax=Candidatus Nealsoniibacteriota TaxID=1817911 RepID=A0A1G2EG85_9BACT|nr:MAG: hypothetical protein A2626_01015 [Candidatus Nealsonbacteria bacterium RIFCSPHIGHO2_01_FULL_38_55]OGZ22242.1 MAG: hypothetical protein A3C48_01645 [Candidatus Nealsonbacteria bacterium RIFCSPHIGHO2_02_FULL_38_75]OGZ22577.1 MAG: hypothetical protein A3E18_01950 [Candidatus Nealsonbacteria bacterium RIFCSPHIGHO2_12_FULL_38_18]OGZ23678.1 MAG: hypothetical protein A2981_00400 [Candidatus Nealsonbacteria bacterium RIFCSPLOWO2_01_FULL_38_120]OGZ24786.1 MAG: hypothetical protein A2W71_00255 [C